jgi:molybdopterin converting factor small subunit
MVEVRLLAFGPVGERLGGRHHVREVAPGTSLHRLVVDLGLEDWLSMGMALAVDGTHVDAETEIHAPVEVALLPPMSGG